MQQRNPRGCITRSMILQLDQPMDYVTPTQQHTMPTTTYQDMAGNQGVMQSECSSLDLNIESSSW